MSIFINFVDIQDQKFNINKLENTGNTFLIILQKNFVSILYSFWQVSIGSMKIVNVQGEAICSAGLEKKDITNQII